MKVTTKFLTRFIGKSWEIMSAISEELSIHTKRSQRYTPLQIFILFQALEEVDKDIHLKRVMRLTKSKSEYVRRIRGGLLANNLLDLNLENNTIVVPQEMKEIIMKIAEEKLLHTSKKDIIEDTYGNIDIKLIEKHEGIEYKGDIEKVFGG